MKTESKKTAKEKTSAAQTLNFDLMHRITDRAYWLALEMIHLANHRPQKEKGEPKVGGHPSACASSKHILAAIHLVMRKPEDYLACKPHISPMDHAFNFLLHNFRDKEGNRMALEDRQTAMRNLRHFSKTGEPVFQSYHAESDPDSFRYYPSGSVGIPPVNALYTSLGYAFAKDHGYDLKEDPTFYCIMGDSEFREGSLMEAMPDAGERQLGNLVWIVDYNRQNLDGTRILNEEALGGSDADRICRLGEANGWRSVKLKHGKIREKAFKKPGGEELKRVLDEEITDFELQALIASQNMKLVRDVLGKKSAKLQKFLKEMSDKELSDIFYNFGGHDIESLVEVFQEAKKHPKRPTLLVAYTIKGHSLRCAGHSGNHSAMPEEDELIEMSKRLGTSHEDPFQDFGSQSAEEKFLASRRKELTDGIEDLIQRINQRQENWIEQIRAVDFPSDFDITALKFSPVAHTQWMWGQIAAKLDRLAHGNAKVETENDQAWAKVAKYFMTMAPDVGSSTNTSPNMNGKLYGDIGQEDFEAEYGAKDTKAPDVVPHLDKRTGHIRFEIAEGNCMSAAGSFGKFFYFTGIPFFPSMTIYDFFIKRAHDQFYYNLYWHSSFATLGTPSGVTLAAEGAQHSWKSDFQIPNCVTWEPCFAKELEWILADHLKKHFTLENQDREAILVRCVTKGIVQKELLERLKKQKRFEGHADAEILESIRQHTLKGAYALVDYQGFEDYRPGDNVVHLFAMGALVPEALKASDKLLEKGIYANVFVVTSSDLLLGNFAYHENYEHLKEGLGISGNLYLHRVNPKEISTQAEWMSLKSGRVPVVSIHDGEPGLLDNIGSIVGVKHHSLSIRKTSKSGTTWDIFELHHLDSASIAETAEKMLGEAAEEEFIVNPSVL
ncbi:MAG: pyruvate dehydrogenase [Pseudomonadota bacterium]